MDLKSQKFQHLEVLKFLYQLAPGNFISDEKVYKFYLPTGEPRHTNIDVRNGSYFGTFHILTNCDSLFRQL